MKQHTGNHEYFEQYSQEKQPSNRNFGWTMAAAFFLFFALAVYHHHHVKAFFLLAISFAFIVALLTCERRLTPLNRAWMKLGELLHYITNPILMLLIYLLAIVPMGLLLKCFGKDPLKRAFDPDAATYWIQRAPGPQPETMKNQF